MLILSKVMHLTGKTKPVMEVRASPVEVGSGALRFEGYAALASG